MSKASVAITHPLNFEVSKKKSWSAWSMSMAMHFTLVILLGITIRVAPKGIMAEPDREAAIVLVNSNSADEVSYFDETDAATEANEDQTKSEPQQSTAQAVESALPPAEEASSLKLPDIALPGTEAVNVGTDQLIQVPSINPRGRPDILPGLGDDAILAEDALRNQGKGPTGPPAYMSVFGSPAVEGHSFILLVDRSKSMGGDGLGALTAAESQFVAAMAGLKENHKFQIMTYNHRPEYFQGEQKLVTATEENKQAALKYFRGVVAFGKTDHGVAILNALLLRPDVIFLMTDGGTPILLSRELRSIAKRAGGRTTIHCIQFGFGPSQEDDNFLKRMTSLTDGSYRYVDMNAR